LCCEDKEGEEGPSFAVSFTQEVGIRKRGERGDGPFQLLVGKMERNTESFFPIEEKKKKTGTDTRLEKRDGKRDNSTSMKKNSWGKEVHQ